MMSHPLTTDTINDRAQYHKTYIDKYVNFAPPLGMPCLLVDWQDSLADVVSKTQSLGLTTKLVTEPNALEIVGRKSRFLVRDYTLAAIPASKSGPAALRLYDQYCVFEHHDEADSWCFIDVLVDTITQHKLRLNEDCKPNTKTRNFVIRSAGYVLACVVACVPRFDPDNVNAVDTLLHWSLMYVRENENTGARQSDNTSQNSDVFDGTAHSR